ncbi:hypothetical protein EDD85DRAFT_366289 [Armillaria nabsnona]|nr:hypothetical protein EDD85DRAFT_366289 [Armillaria nabsnona]
MKGKALLATGSPSPPVKMPESGRIISLLSATVSRFSCFTTFVLIVLLDAPIYPGLGFGVMLCQSRKMKDTMIITGARIGIFVRSIEAPDAAPPPGLGDAPQITIAVTEEGIEEGCADVGYSKEEVRGKAKAKLSGPVYTDSVYSKVGEAWTREVGILVYN